MCPLALYWIMRAWLIASRGNMPDDPIIFALRDRVSYIVAGLTALLILLATLLGCGSVNHAVNRIRVRCSSAAGADLPNSRRRSVARRGLRELTDCLRQESPRGMIARGLGRSYGDSASSSMAKWCSPSE